MNAIERRATIVVSGLPGSGKSTTGLALGAALELPMVDKDDYLEALFNDGSVIGEAQRAKLSRRADELFQAAVQTEPRCIAASFWRVPELSPTSGTPTEWLFDLPNVVEVYCDCPPDVAATRFLTRSRHAAHGDDTRDPIATIEAFQALRAAGPIGIERLVIIDTSAEVDAIALARQIARLVDP